MDIWNDRFEAILRQRLAPDRRTTLITPDLDLRDAGLDSLTLIDLLLALETEYAVELPDDMLTVETFRTPRTLWSALSSVRG